MHLSVNGEDNTVVEEHSNYYVQITKRIV